MSLSNPTKLSADSLPPPPPTQPPHSPLLVAHLAILEVERLHDAPLVLLICLALPGVHGHPSHGDGGSRVVLGAENVAARPLDLRDDRPLTLGEGRNVELGASSVPEL